MHPDPVRRTVPCPPVRRRADLQLYFPALAGGVFLLLGGELLSTLPKTGQKFSFDGASIVLLVIMLLFAMCMAGADTFFQALDHYEWIRF